MRIELIFSLRKSNVLTIRRKKRYQIRKGFEPFFKDLQSFTLPIMLSNRSNNFMKKKLYKKNLLKNKGIGYSKALEIFKLVGINTRIQQVNFRSLQLNKINKIVKKLTYNNTYQYKIYQSIEFYKKLKNYKGNRHSCNYPVRGQRTHSNAKTIKRIKSIKKSPNSTF